MNDTDKAICDTLNEIFGELHPNHPFGFATQLLTTLRSMAGGLDNITGKLTEIAERLEKIESQLGDSLTKR